MSFTSDEDLAAIALKLKKRIYETPFRGKDRGRFALTRGQMRQALGVARLHASSISRLQDKCLENGIVLIDLDDLFPCIATNVIRKYRRPPKAIFGVEFPESGESDHDGAVEPDGTEE